MYKLPKLPYSFSDLEPYLDRETLEVHYNGHHRSYIEKINKTINENSQYFKEDDLLKILVKSLPTFIEDSIRINGGAHLAHSMYWKIMKKDGEGVPIGVVDEEIEKHFGNFKDFKKIFTSEAVSFVGSGWTWLVMDKNKNLFIISTLNHNHPILYGLYPVLVIDLWEHAYYLKYKNLRVNYIDNWWNVVNWEQVEKNYKEALENIKVG